MQSQLQRVVEENIPDLRLLCTYAERRSPERGM